MDMKKKIMGIPIVAFIIGLLVVGGATAALVSYLSNTVTATATVESPMELSVSADGIAYSNNVAFGSVVGGSTVDLYVKTHNKANFTITGTMENIVSNPLGLTCADFTSLTASVEFLEPTPASYPSSSITCAVVTPTSVKLISTPTTPWNWGANSLDVAHVVIKFNPAASGTYTVTTKVLV